MGMGFGEWGNMCVFQKICDGNVGVCENFI